MRQQGSGSRRFIRCLASPVVLIEAMESRTLLSDVTVSTVADELDGDTTSIAALIANPGGGTISLRGAITGANNNISDGDLIKFALQDGDVPFRFKLNSNLPEIKQTLTIDGYSQNGAHANTQVVGNDAKLVIVVQPAAS